MTTLDLLQEYISSLEGYGVETIVKHYDWNNKGEIDVRVKLPTMESVVTIDVLDYITWLHFNRHMKSFPMGFEEIVLNPEWELQQRLNKS